MILFNSKTEVLFAKTSVFLFLILSFSGCASKTTLQIFKEESKRQNINFKTMYSICKKESSLNNNVVNVNKSILDIQRGPHYFKSSFKTNLYMDFVLDPLNLNYDIGICQINKQHLKKNNLDNEDLLDIRTNVRLATSIYKYNLKKCDFKIICALSMYNTGKRKSSIGFKYANNVLKIRKNIFGN
jgi:hypothetical protein